MLHLPSLGLPDPAGEWVTLRAANGTKKQCVTLLTAWRPEDDAPLRPTETEFGTVKAQFQGAVWSIPTAHANTGAKSELFRVKIRRQLASSVPEDVERKRFTNDVEAIFLGKASHELKAASLSLSQSGKRADALSVQVTGSSPNTSCSLAVWKLLRLCTDPTPAQCAPQQPPDEPAAAEKSTKAHQEALELWCSRGNRHVNLGWMQGLRDLAIAGMEKASRAKLEEADETKIHLAGFRVSPEKDHDVRGVDYAMNLKGPLAVKEHNWRPMPLQAMDEEWVRCGVNLTRLKHGKKLIAKEEWPPQPTTLMLKFGKKG